MAVVLHPAGEIGVAWPRRVHAALLRLRRIDVPRIHRSTPVFEIAVANGDGDRRSERLAATDAAGDFRLVVLDLHPPTAPVAMLAAGEIAVDALAIEAHARRHAADDDRELRAVGFAGRRECEPHSSFF